ncbi:MAG: PilZ domain-containing protein [Proteobacteria bacterium]|nr:PilZ domain-containing protein [Pseudomonadota bacterium]
MDIIRPGLRLKIVVDINHIKETNDVRNSIIFDVIEKKLLIAQTEPPILKSRINKAIILTYLTKENKEDVRYGFEASIVDLVNNYELSADNITQAVILLSKTNPVQYNLRFFFRAEPPSNSGLDLSIYRKPVNILDISIGGAKISHHRELKLEPGRILDIKLSIDGAVFDLNAVVVRTWDPKEGKMVKSLEFVALEFINTSMQLKNILGKKIISIQRELRSREIL